MLRLLQICSCLNSFQGPFEDSENGLGMKLHVVVLLLDTKSCELWILASARSSRGSDRSWKQRALSITNVSQVDGLTRSPYHHILCNLTQKLQVWKYPMYRVTLYISATLGVWWKWPSDVGGGATPGWFSGWWSRSGAGRGADTPPGGECSPTEITAKYVTIH